MFNKPKVYFRTRRPHYAVGRPVALCNSHLFCVSVIFVFINFYFFGHTTQHVGS